MRQTLEQWLNCQEVSRYNSAIKLGLDRCRTVAERLHLLPLPFPVISVAGTNGKGSTVAAIEAILAVDHRVGAFTSPHLLHFGERIRVAGEDLTVPAMRCLFEQVDAVRGDVELTYFECCTLMAVLHFFHQKVDLAILEVGLGGRLDAVNVFPPTVTVITRIALDHCQWLGNNREQIGAEKSAIMRPHRKAVCGDPDPPQSLFLAATERRALLVRVGVDYHYQCKCNGWSWSDQHRQLSLPEPGLTDNHRYLHCATAIAVVFALEPHWHPLPATIATAIKATTIRGRCQQLYFPTTNKLEATQPEVIIDIAHNPEATESLAAFLHQRNQKLPKRRTLAIVSVLQDKDASAMFEPFKQLISHWYCVSQDAPRGRKATALCHHCPGLSSAFDHLEDAYQVAAMDCDKNDLIIIFGSVLIVSEALRLAHHKNSQNRSVS